MQKIKIYQSVFMESFIKDLYDSLKELTKILHKNNIDFTVIGGASLSEYHYDRITEDVDILIAKKDKDKVKNLPIGFIRDISNGRGQVFTLHNPKTKVEVIYEGDSAGNDKGIVYKHPNKISVQSKGIPFISLKNLVEYKLSSGIYGKRYKDFSDVQELIKRNNLNRTYGNSFREDLKNKYIKLFDEILD